MTVSFVPTRRFAVIPRRRNRHRRRHPPPSSRRRRSCSRRVPSRSSLYKSQDLFQDLEALFIGAFEKLSSEYPTITLNPLRVDTFSSSFPRRHKEFRLVATTNLFGDILSDQASGLAGGVGLAPSLNAGGDHAMAQAVHGTAPDIAGRGLANPAALIPVDRTVTELAVSADACAGMPLDCAAPPARRRGSHRRRHPHR